MSDLKPCPFCNHTDIMHIRANNSLDFSMRISEDSLVCQECKYTISDKSAMKLIERWNTRPIEDALRAENERLRAELSSCVYHLEYALISEEDGKDDIVRVAGYAAAINSAKTLLREMIDGRD